MSIFVGRFERCVVTQTTVFWLWNNLPLCGSRESTSTAHGPVHAVRMVNHMYQAACKASFVTIQAMGLVTFREYELVTLREYGLVTLRENVPGVFFPPREGGCQLVHRPKLIFVPALLRISLTAGEDEALDGAPQSYPCRGIEQQRVWLTLPRPPVSASVKSKKSKYSHVLHPCFRIGGSSCGRHGNELFLNDLGTGAPTICSSMLC